MQQSKSRVQVPALAIVLPIDAVRPVLAPRRGSVWRRKAIIRACGGLQVGADYRHEKRRNENDNPDQSRRFVPHDPPASLMPRKGLWRNRLQCAANSPIHALYPDQLTT